MENLLSAHPDITVVHTINEPTAAGAYAGARRARQARTRSLMVSVDGGCTGVKTVKDGEHRRDRDAVPAASWRQLGVEAAARRVPRPRRPSRRACTSTTRASQLITDQPVEGVDSQDTTWGLGELLGLTCGLSLQDGVANGHPVLVS